MRFAAALLLAACALAAQAQDVPRVRLQDDALIFLGEINAISAGEFLAMLPDQRLTRVVISSGGGDVAAALDMAEALFARGLDVEVPLACYSSCANYVFPAGRRKLLGHPGAIGWHGNLAHIVYLQDTRRSNHTERQMVGARLLAAREAQFFARIGIDGFVCWFGKIAPYDVPQFYGLAPDDMERFGIRNVTVNYAANQRPIEDVRLLRPDWPTLESVRPAAAAAR